MHCWKDRAEYMEEYFGNGSPEHLSAMYFELSATCMLEDEHDGPHEWTLDSDVLITFGDGLEDTYEKECGFFGELYDE